MITKNKIRDHFRSLDPGGARGRPLSVERLIAPSGSGNDATDEELEPGTLHRALQIALELIRPECAEQTWQAFWRATVEGQDTAVIARDLAMKPSSVYQAKSRVLRRLRQKMNELLRTGDLDSFRVRRHRSCD